MEEHFTSFMRKKKANYRLKTWQEDNSTDNICYLEKILQTWTTLYLLIFPINMDYWDELNIDGGKDVLACF